MDRNTMRRLSQFALVADAAMNAIPLSVPPQPSMAEWDGQMFDVSELHAAYNRLPAGVQAMVADSYGRCLQVLAQQNRTAFAALDARYRLFSDLMTRVGVTPEQLVPDMRRDPHLSLVPDPDAPQSDADHDDIHPRASADNENRTGDDDSAGDENSNDNDGSDDDALGLPIPLLPLLDDHDPDSCVVSARRLPRRIAWWYVAAASLVIGCLGTSAWHHYTAPAQPRHQAMPTAAPMPALDVSMRSDDMPAASHDLDSADVNHLRVTNTDDGDGDTRSTMTSEPDRHRQRDVDTRGRAGNKPAHDPWFAPDTSDGHL